MSTAKRAATKTTKKPEAKPAKKRAPAAKPRASSTPAPARAAAKAPVKEPAKAPTRARKSAAAAPVAVAPPPPPRTIYNLDGPIPPEGKDLPPKVGALLAVGQKALGIKNFRPGQASSFDHLLANRDLLAVMPTGSGKSLLYQLTSLVVPGVTVVVSPLIALIKDQIDKMVAKGVTAVRIDSTLTVKQRREVDALIRSPGGKLLLTTPERMADPEFRTFLREAASGVGVSRFVVDEAHCVSQWGHDFRPAYLSLRKALDDVGRPPVLATTATAPPHVREDILFQLGIEGASIVTTTFDRPNLHYEVIVFDDETEKMKTLVTLLKKLPRPGIVYCATVKKVEELYEALGRHGIPVARYHGRLNKNERTTEQQRFMDSHELVMIATNAFGLGVDKPDIRNVIHYHVPGSLEAYAQEAGRGGRDGKPARCVLLFSPDDVAIQEYFLSGTYPTRRQVRQVYDALEAFGELTGQAAEDSPPTVANLALSSAVGAQRTRTVLSLLKDEHFITEKDGGLYYIAVPPPEGIDLNERARQYEARRIADRQRLDALLAYVKTPGCRNQVILEYLGEPEPPRCGRCDNCLRSREAALAASTQASRLGASLTRHFEDDTVEKPKREIKARTVRIDQPPAEPVAAAPAVAVRPAQTVLRRSGGGGAGASAPPIVTAAGAAAVAASAASAPRPPTIASTVAAVAANAAAAPAAPAKPAPAKPNNGEPGAEDDDELDDGEDDDLDDDEDDDELAEGEDDDDDDLDDDEDDDDLDDDDDDEDDDIEVIDKTAAELAEEGIEGPGEVTVLARKRVPKPAKQRPQQQVATDPASASAAEARRRRRRRRRKRRAMLPPKSAFTTPVLSTGGPLVEAPRGRGGGGGPVIEYVRGPMRIAMAPVASANPNDAGGATVGGRRKRGGFGPRGGGFDRRPGTEFRRRDNGPPRGPNGGGAGNFERRPDGVAVQGGDAPTDPNGPDGRRRRRRRRRRGPGNGAPMQPGGPMGANGGPNGGAAGNGGPMPSGNGHPDAPVSFFQPANGGGNSDAPPMLGPDGLPLRKRRRRRRRGRGGRQREWRGAAGPDGAPGPDGGGAPSDGAQVASGGAHDGDHDGDSDDGGDA